MVSVEGLLNGTERIDMSPQSQVNLTFKQAPKAKQEKATAHQLFAEAS